MHCTINSFRRLWQAPQALVIAAFLLLMLPGIVPAQLWLEVRSVTVPTAQAGAPVALSVNRSIRRHFHADWDVLVRRRSPMGWLIVCTAHGGGDYRPDAVLPENLTLDWWTEGACPTLARGTYIVTTTWEVETGLPILIPPRRVTAQSNPFIVK
ncbi:MAG: hypothetical protein CSA72_10620 [Rhodobacterales bacterium]|nr:MAG: hypothetical protein CSA72_10620 [Rhodobacterales bacterium]